MQHLVVKGLGRRAVAEALAGERDDLRKGRFGEVNQPGLAGERAPQAADGVLHAPLLPGGAGIAEESLDTQGMEALGVRIVPGLPGDEAATGADVAVQGGQD